MKRLKRSQDLVRMNMKESRSEITQPCECKGQNEEWEALRGIHAARGKGTTEGLGSLIEKNIKTPKRSTG